MFRKPSIDTLLHYGVKRRSGRYPYGSGKDDFLNKYDSLKSQGLSQTDIANKMGITTTQLRNNITWADKERRDFIAKQVNVLKEAKMSNVAIGAKLGISEATVRNYLKPVVNKVEKLKIDNVTDAIKSGVDNTGYLDVGVGVERQLGVSRTKFNTVVNKLVSDEGYHVHEVYVKRLNDNTATDAANGQFAKYTTVKVLTKDPDVKSTRKNSDKIRPLDSWSDDGSLSLTKTYPPHILPLKRIHIRYKEDGGEDKDGLIELRPGVKDLDLGRAKYAQVRIGAEGNLYLKGMAAYSDEKHFPKGVDIIFNTNKTKDVPVEKVLKKMKKTPEETEDPSTMFGSSVSKQKGALNIVNEQGEWDKWSTTMSSQFLSKQPVKLVKDRLDATDAALRKEYDEINSLTNPVVKKYLMEKYIEGLDSKAKHLKAKGLPNTKSHVLLPFPDMKANEIYAPNYKNGDRVVLVRHPHGGIFEIPELTVNNNHEGARKMIGPNSPDAVGIHPSVAGKLSGADFDGDTALVIPNNHGLVKTSRSLQELKNFDPHSYKVGPDSPVNIHKIDPKTGEMINTGHTITPDHKQTQMGLVSNLITDMTIKDASPSEIARAVKHSMVVIDAEKHNLDWKQSAIDNGISALKRKYQAHVNPDTGKKTIGASTLISRSKNKVNISDPNFDPDKYSSKTATEQLYSNYIKGVMSIKNEAQKSYDKITPPKYSRDAAKKYAPELDSLNTKLNTALLNAPKERQAQILTNKLFYANRKPDMSKDEIKKLKARSLNKARDVVGANKKDVTIKIEPKEWEAIQSGAISPTKLLLILKNADMDVVRQLATPRESKLTTAKATRAKVLLDKGYTIAEVADQLGVSTTTLREELK